MKTTGDSEDAAIKPIKKAYKNGINYYDTNNVYGKTEMADVVEKKCNN